MQKFALVLAGRLHSKIRRYELQELQRGEAAVKNVGVSNLVALEVVEQAAYQQGFPGANFSREHHETLALTDGVVQRRQRIIVLARRKQKRRIRRDFERVLR